MVNQGHPLFKDWLRTVDNNKRTVLMIAVKNDLVEIVKILLLVGAESTMDMKDQDGRTAMDIAKKNDNDDMISLLERKQSYSSYNHVGMKSSDYAVLDVKELKEIDSMEVSKSQTSHVKTIIDCTSGMMKLYDYSCEEYFLMKLYYKYPGKKLEWYVATSVMARDILY